MRVSQVFSQSARDIPGFSRSSCNFKYSIWLSDDILELFTPFQRPVWGLKLGAGMGNGLGLFWFDKAGNALILVSAPVWVYVEQAVVTLW